MTFTIELSKKTALHKTKQFNREYESKQIKLGLFWYAVTDQLYVVRNHRSNFHILTQQNTKVDQFESVKPEYLSFC